MKKQNGTSLQKFSAKSLAALLALALSFSILTISFTNISNSNADPATPQNNETESSELIDEPIDTYVDEDFETLADSDDKCGSKNFGPYVFCFKVKVTNDPNDPPNSLQFQIPTSGRSGPDLESDDNNPSFKWKVDWGDGQISGDVNGESDTNSQGKSHTYNNPGEYLITIEPKAPQQKAWLAAFGFLNNNNGANVQSNRNKVTRIVSPIFPEMTRENNNQTPNFEWAFTFGNISNDLFTMGDFFTFDATAWENVLNTGNSFGFEMFKGVSSPSFQMGNSFNLPQNFEETGTNFMRSAFEGVTSNYFTMNNKFNLPQNILSVGNYFASSMFQGCISDTFNMNQIFNLPPDIVGNVGSHFASHLFRGVTSDLFKLNALFNLPPGITETNSNFAANLFSGVSGNSFTLNEIFNFPRGIVSAGSSFAREIFADTGTSFNLNQVFNFPQNIGNVGNDFAAKMFANVSNPNFKINQIFKLPNLTNVNLAKSGVFEETLNLGSIAPRQNRGASAILNGNGSPNNTLLSTFAPSGNSVWFDLCAIKIRYGGSDDCKIINYETNAPNVTISDDFAFHSLAIPEQDSILPADNSKKLSRSGYVFKEWNTKSNGSGEGYQDSANLGLINETITLYAIWKYEYNDDSCGNQPFSPFVFCFYIEAQSPKQNFAIPTSGRTGQNTDETLNNPNYDWNIDWGDGAQIQNTSGISGINSKGVSHQYENMGIYLVKITPKNSSQNGWLKAFGFYKSEIGANSQVNKNTVIRLVSPIYPEMTRATASDVPNFEWAYAFNSLQNEQFAMGKKFNLENWKEIVNIGNGFAKSFLYSSGSANFQINNIFKLPKFGAEQLDKIEVYANSLNLNSSVPLQNMASFLVLNGNKIAQDDSEYDSSAKTFGPAGIEVWQDLCAIQVHFGGEMKCLILAYDPNADDAVIDGGFKHQIFQPGDSITLEDGNSIRLSRPNYEFYEWNASSDGSGIGYQDGSSLGSQNREVILYAIWKGAPYDVKFNPTEGSGIMQNQSFFMGLKPQELLSNTFTAPAGYEFGGWSLTESNRKIDFVNNELVRDLAKDGQNIVNLYAVWAGISYSVTFKNGGGIGNDETVAGFIYGMEKVLAPATNYSKTGYKQIGWAKNENATNADYGLGAAVTNLSANGGNVVLYAVWSANPYSVQYAKNNESETGCDKLQTGFIYGVPKALQPPSCTKTGYTLSGWSKTINSNLATFSINQIVTDLSIDGTNAILYPVWKSNPYAIRFDPNGGTGSMTDQQFVYDEALKKLTKSAFVRTGYTFAGWSKSKTSTVPDFTDERTVQNLASSGVLILFAVWKGNPYSVKFTINNTTEVGCVKTQTGFIYGIANALQPPSCTKAGYTLTGWSLTKNGAKNYGLADKVSTLTNALNGVVNLYPVWTQVPAPAFSALSYSWGTGGTLNLSWKVTPITNVSSFTIEINNALQNFNNFPSYFFEKLKPTKSFTVAMGYCKSETCTIQVKNLMVSKYSISIKANMKTGFLAPPNFATVPVNKLYVQNAFTFVDLGGVSPERATDIKWLSSVRVGVGENCDSAGKGKDCKFLPEANVNRGAMAQFLHKLGGYVPIVQKVPNITTKDLDGLSNDRKNSIKWLASEGITIIPVSGNDKDKYLPSGFVTRGAMAQFLWKLAGRPAYSEDELNNKPATKIENDKDMAELKKSNKERYYNILWLIKNNITYIDPKEGKYNPGSNVNRGAMAQLLHKLYYVMMTGQSVPSNGIVPAI